MDKMINIASDFQYSVNINYDINNEKKIRNFIATNASLKLLEDILLSTQNSSTERARILIGAYGKGKSHIMLMILSFLMQKDIALFDKILIKIKENTFLSELLNNYYTYNKKLLPVIISVSNTSLSQAFILSLQRTLSENNLLDIMPETNYFAAVAVIERWKTDYPATYNELEKLVGYPLSIFKEKLTNFNTEAYEIFERIYPKLTAGSMFNPFLGFDVVELYEKVVQGIKRKGYAGIYVVYDEFSKFLESNITTTTVSDTKMLQDFAEKCNRSGEEQLHLMLISHKEISNYIDSLPKQKVDGWRGISERFLHIHLNNNFSQTYEVISSVIQKNNIIWEEFCIREQNKFRHLIEYYKTHPILLESTETEKNILFYGCYPLHPISTYILPRLSEKVAQNERTLFTFLSSNGVYTLSDFIAQNRELSFNLITPDYIYDYFESLLRKESYGSNYYDIYQLTSYIISKLNPSSLEVKIIKTISLMYVLEQFEKLRPTQDEIIGIYSMIYDIEAIKAAIINLIEKEYVVYLKRSNNFLQLKQTTGIDIKNEISNTIDTIKDKITIKDILNEANTNAYLYPSLYNVERDMVRFFNFQFIEEHEAIGNIDWDIKSEQINADGVIYAIIPSSQPSIENIKNQLLLSSHNTDRCVFIIPKKYVDIRDIAIEFKAISILRDKYASDTLLFNEYDMVYDDLREILAQYISSYTNPEYYKSLYIYNGLEKNIKRRTELSNLLSDICDKVYCLTPIINNESINRNEITAIANNSRYKIVSGLLRNELEYNLGLTGIGQEVSIMRSTLIKTEVLKHDNGYTFINFNVSDDNLKYMFSKIIEFIEDLKIKGTINVKELYDILISPKYHIGLRKGLIPIYLAAVFHNYKKNLVLSDRYAQVAINADALIQMNINPEYFTLSYLDWDPAKEEYIKYLETIFEQYIIVHEKKLNTYDYILSSMKRWYMELPSYVKQVKKDYNNNSINTKYISFLRLLKQNIGSNEFLFTKLPECFGYKQLVNKELCTAIKNVKDYFDQYLYNFKQSLVYKLKELFIKPQYLYNIKSHSLYSIIHEWLEILSPRVFEQLFNDGTDKCLKVFKDISYDEDKFVSRLAYQITDLRIEDWCDTTVDEFFNKLKQCKTTAELFEGKSASVEDKKISGYEISFINDNGECITKRLDSVERTQRGNLLYNLLTDGIASMGNSISEQEKRQIVMDLLKDLCF